MALIITQEVPNEALARNQETKALINTDEQLIMEGKLAEAREAWTKAEEKLADGWAALANRRESDEQ